MSLLIFGCGYLGSRVVALRQQEGLAVRVATRSAEKAALLRSQNLAAVVADINEPNTLVPELFADVDTVLFSVGFDRQGGKIRDVYETGLANVLAKCPASLQQVIYISSTGVYGKGTGEQIDETSPTQPEREGGIACLAAENLLRNSLFAERALVLRLAGIYGPQRIPRAEDILQGKPITAVADSWLNLIHVADAAQIVCQAIAQNLVQEVLNVADGHPVQRRDFYYELAKLLHQPPPTFVEPAPEAAPLARGGDKRISNQRLLQKLQPTFQFPSYREGLAAIVNAAE